MRVLAFAFTGSLVVSAAIAAATAATACGGRRLPAPSYVGQPQDALVQVPYPPPPARVEFVPDQPDGDAVWLDGEWVWQGRRYAWKPGRWVKPPPNSAFAPWSTVRDTMGSLYIAEGSWRDRNGRELPPPEPLKVGLPSAGAVTDPEGDTQAAAGTQSPDASTTKSDGGVTDDTRSARDLIVDSGPDFKVDAQQLPDGALAPPDGSVIPDAAGGFDATFDAEPARIQKP